MKRRHAYSNRTTFYCSIPQIELFICWKFEKKIWIIKRESLNFVASIFRFYCLRKRNEIRLNWEHIFRIIDSRGVWIRACFNYFNVCILFKICIFDLLGRSLIPQQWRHTTPKKKPTIKGHLESGEKMEKIEWNLKKVGLFPEGSDKA